MAKKKDQFQKRVIKNLELLRGGSGGGKSPQQIIAEHQAKPEGSFIKEILAKKQQTPEQQTQQQPTGDQIKAQDAQLKQANRMQQKLQAQKQVVTKQEQSKEEAVKQPAQPTRQNRITSKLQRDATTIKKDTPTQPTKVTRTQRQVVKSK